MRHSAHCHRHRSSQPRAVLERPFVYVGHASRYYYSRYVFTFLEGAVSYRADVLRHRHGLRHSYEFGPVLVEEDAVPRVVLGVLQVHVYRCQTGASGEHVVYLLHLGRDVYRCDFRAALESSVLDDGHCGRHVEYAFLGLRHGQQHGFVAVIQCAVVRCVFCVAFLHCYAFQIGAAPYESHFAYVAHGFRYLYLAAVVSLEGVVLYCFHNVGLAVDFHFLRYAQFALLLAHVCHACVLVAFASRCFYLVVHAVYLGRHFLLVIHVGEASPHR